MEIKENMWEAKKKNRIYMHYLGVEIEHFSLNSTKKKKYISFN